MRSLVVFAAAAILLPSTAFAQAAERLHGSQASKVVGARFVAAASKQARCRIVMEGVERLSGPCQFSSLDRQGSFQLTSTRKNAPLMPGNESVTVWIRSPGLAEVVTFTGQLTARWGAATRSNKDRACWVSEDSDFVVCAY